MTKSILENLNAEKGKPHFVIYLNKDDNSLVLKVQENKEREFSEVRMITKI